MQKYLFLALSLCLPFQSWAWGRRGHEIVAQTAGILASAEDGASALKAHTYDLGYYANVPDFIWKRPATYEREKPQHFMDMEIFTRAFVAKPEVQEPFKLSRKEFEETFPDVKEDAGRAFWRIRELQEELEKLASGLRTEKDGKARRALQERWILLAGVMGHYVGDLGMPLHVSENYDGNLTDQKGIHAYFEDTCVDELFPKLAADVMVLARKQERGFRAKNGKRTVLELLQDLATSSQKEVKTLLAIDKKSKRADVERTCSRYAAMIGNRLAASSLVLGELYRRTLGWKFDNERFYFFAGEPAYIPTAAGASPAPAPAAAEVKTVPKSAP